jgi:hypothetical protein
MRARGVCKPYKAPHAGIDIAEAQSDFAVTFQSQIPRRFLRFQKNLLRFVQVRPCRIRLRHAPCITHDRSRFDPVGPESLPVQRFQVQNRRMGAVNLRPPVDHNFWRPRAARKWALPFFHGHMRAQSAKRAPPAAPFFIDPSSDSVGGDSCRRFESVGRATRGSPLSGGRFAPAGASYRARCTC